MGRDIEVEIQWRGFHGSGVATIHCAELRRWNETLMEMVNPDPADIAAHDEMVACPNAAGPPAFACTCGGANSRLEQWGTDEVHYGFANVEGDRLPVVA